LRPPLPPRRLDRLAPSVEHPRHLHRLVGRDLAARHRADGRIERRDHVASFHTFKSKEI